MKQLKFWLARTNDCNEKVLMNPVRFLSSEYLCVYITRSMYLSFKWLSLSLSLCSYFICTHLLIVYLSLHRHGLFTNASWVLAGDHIRTQFGRSRDAYVVLIFKIEGFRGQESPNKDITMGTVEFQFETTCGGNCEMLFLSVCLLISSLMNFWIP